VTRRDSFLVIVALSAIILIVVLSLVSAIRTDV